MILSMLVKIIDGMECVEGNLNTVKILWRSGRSDENRLELIKI